MNLIQCRSFIIRRWKTTEESSSYTVSVCELKLFHYQESLLHLRSLDTFLCQTTSHHPSLYHPSSLSPTSIPHRSNPTHWWIRYIQLRTHHNRRAEYSSGDSFAFGYPEVSEHSPTIQLATICGWTDAYTLGWLNRRIHSGWLKRRIHSGADFTKRPRNGPIYGDVSLLSDHSTEDLHPLIDQLSSSVTDPLMRSATVNSGALPI